jgi:hypothetical protein
MEGYVLMKLLSLATALGIGLAFSVGAQTTTDEQQQPAGKETKARVEEGTRTHEDVSATAPRENERVKAGVSSREEAGAVSHSTTVFRHGQQTKESLSLHRGMRDRADVHFAIGTHPRDWWLRTYSIVLIDGCHYYLADNGCWYPAYGFDPSCDFPGGVVYCD